MEVNTYILELDRSDRSNEFMLESTLWVDIDVTECMPRTCHLWSYAMLLCNRFLNNWGLKIWFWARAVKVQSNLFNWIALNSFYRSGRTVLWWCPILATSPTVARTLVAPEHYIEPSNSWSPEYPCKSDITMCAADNLKHGCSVTAWLNRWTLKYSVC